MPKANEAKRATEAAIKRATQERTGGDWQTLNIYKGRYSLQELQIIRKTLAKRANQRLVRLEAPTAVSKITGESFAGFGAADIAYEYIKENRFAGGEAPDKLRFSENFGFQANSLWDIKKEIVVLQTFLESKSSTVKGQKQIEAKRLKTFESGEWGTGGQNRKLKFASTKEFYEFLNSDTFEEIRNIGFNSEDIIDIYDKARDKNSADKVAEELAGALEDYRNKQAVPSLKDLNKRVLKGSKNT